MVMKLVWFNRYFPESINKIETDLLNLTDKELRIEWRRKYRREIVFPGVILNKQKEARTRIMKRDKDECICCGLKIDLDLHHIVPLDRIQLNYFKSKSDKDKIRVFAEIFNKEENLVILCRKCHSAFHSRSNPHRKEVKKDVRNRLNEMYPNYKDKLIHIFAVIYGKKHSQSVVEKGLLCK